MEVEAARMLLYAITAVGVVVWVMSIRFVRASFFPSRDRAPDDLLETETRSAGGPISGSATVEGTPGELAAKAASVMAGQGGGTVGTLKIVESSADRLVVEGIGDASGPKSTGGLLRRAELRFRPARGGQTQVDYEIDVRGGRGLLLGAQILQLVGLIALVVGFALIHTYVVSNANPAVRWQTIQMIQVVHVLWPPFLIAWIYRHGRTAIRNAIETLIHNLPYRSD